MRVGWSRRRRSTRHDGAAAVLVLGIIVVAAFGVYLLIAAAVAFTVWLVAVATTKTAASEHEAGVVIPSAPPSTEYQALMAVEPSTFDDPLRARSAAHAVLGAWLQQIPKAPKQSADLVRGVEIRYRLIGRLTTDLDGRRYVWCTAPIGGRQKIGSAPLQIDALDPWNPPPNLKATSRYVASCWSCDGGGRTPCMRCSGAARVTCTSCAGSGKYYGTTASGAQRVLNCKSCKGRGSVVCGMCVRGHVDCGLCRKVKKLECWLEIDESSRQDVQLEPDGEVTKAFGWGRDGVIAAREKIELDAHIVDAVEMPRVVGLNDLPSCVPAEWRRDYWARIRAHIQPGERVRSQAFTFLEIPSTAVTYALMGEQQTIAFEGKRMLAPPAATDVLFSRRSSVLGRSKFVLAALPVAALIIYLTRGSYFVGERAGPLVAGIVATAAAASLLAYIVLWYATLGRRSAVKWALAAVAPIAVATALVVLAEPTTARAREYVASDSLEAAKTELLALGAHDDAELVPLWAEIHLKEALASKSCASAMERANEISAAVPQRARAIGYAESLALTAAKEALRAEDAGKANSELGCLSESSRNGVEARAVRAQIAMLSSRSCAQSKEWNCALARVDEASELGAGASASAKEQVYAAIESDFDSVVHTAKSEKDVALRLSVERRALELWSTYLAARQPETTTIKLLKNGVARDEQAVARQQELEKRKHEAAEKRRLADEARQRRREEAAERAHSYSSLVCNDGSLSPSCTCGGSRRGCCSHHGGVSGCRGD
jgi:hypothetical protein